MTPEEKVRAYNEALDKARKLRETCDSHAVVGWCEYIFPELKESEDEKIRKHLIKHFRNKSKEDWNGVPVKSVLAWLEKQGQTRQITHEEICKSYGISDIGEFSDGYHTFNGLYKQRMILFAVLVNTYKDRAWKSWKHEDGLDCFGGGWFIVGIDTPAGTYTYHYEAKDWDRFDCKTLDKAKHWDGHDESDAERLFSLLEKQGEQKEKIFDFKAADWYVSKVDGKIHNIYHSTDNVEPMFKVGDYVVDNCGYVWRIEGIINQFYILEGIDGGESRPTIEWVNKTFHLWTTQDAKDGDILANDHHILILKELVYDWSSNGTPNSVKAYCGIKPNGIFEIGKDNWCFCGTLHIHPATKEQRDLLSKKMTDAGYSFDFESKELIGCSCNY